MRQTSQQMIAMGKRLGALRKRAGLASAREWARLAGFADESYVSKIENGERGDIEVSTLGRLLVVIGVSFDYAVYEQGAVPTDEAMKTAVALARQRAAVTGEPIEAS